MLPVSARDSIIGYTNPTMHPAADAAGAMFLSREDLSTLTEEDKITTGSSGHGQVVAAAPPVAFSYRRASGSMPSVPQSVVGMGGSSGSLGRTHTSQDRTVTLASTEASRAPGGTAHTSLQSSMRGHQSHSSISFSGDSPTLPRASPMSAEMLPINRSSSSGQRRAVRKPVPAYVPTDAQPESFSTLSSADSPLYQVGMDESARSSSDLYGHDPFSGDDVQLPELNHKSSFGDMRPVHYLMPDMPSSSRT